MIGTWILFVMFYLNVVLEGNIVKLSQKTFIIHISLTHSRGNQKTLHAETVILADHPKYSPKAKQCHVLNYSLSNYTRPSISFNRSASPYIVSV